MGKSLITLAEYKAYAGITSPNQDAAIQAIIPKVSALVKSYCKSSFVDYVDDPKSQVFNGGFGSIALDEYPVRSVQSVEYSLDYGLTYTPLTEYTHYVVDGDYVVSVSPGGFAPTLRGYKITYTAGYEELPEDLKLATLDLVTYYIRNDSAVHSPKVPGSNSVQIEYISTTSLPAHIRRVLDLHRRDFA